MVRVTRPGAGWWSSTSTWTCWRWTCPTSDRDFLRRAVHAMTDAMSAGQIGRQLPRRFPGGEADDVVYRAAILAVPYDFAGHVIAGSLLGAVSAGSLTRPSPTRWWRPWNAPSVTVACTPPALFHRERDKP